jgi:hypothetical protein
MKNYLQKNDNMNGHFEKVTMNERKCLNTFKALLIVFNKMLNLETHEHALLHSVIYIAVIPVKNISCFIFV